MINCIATNSVVIPILRCGSTEKHMDVHNITTKESHFFSFNMQLSICYTKVFFSWSFQHSEEYKQSWQIVANFSCILPRNGK